MLNKSPGGGQFRTRAVFCQSSTDPGVVEEIQRFRKSKFVDTLGWPLNADDFGEYDEFDRPDTIHFGLYEGDRVVGCFRAIRTDQPYLARTKFPALASEIPYPSGPVSWEISRLGVMSGGPSFGRSMSCYAAMFHFALGVNAVSLVAFCDVGHERLLRRIGIKTRRFGEPELIDHDNAGRPIHAVAGEIVMAQQDPKRLRLLIAPTKNMEIEDGAALFGRPRLSA